MTRTLIFGILFLSTSVFSQTRNELIIFPVDYTTGLSEEIIKKNKIKSVMKIQQGVTNETDKIEFVQYYSKEGKLEKIVWYGGGPSKNEFVNDGNCTTRKTFQKKFDSNDEEVYQILKTCVNSSGKDSLEINFMENNGEMMLESRTEYTYDSKNNILLETDYTYPPEYKNPIDSSEEELIKRTPDALFSAAGHSEIKYSYDKSGRIIKFETDDKYEISPFEKMHDVWLTKVDYPDKYTARKKMTGEDQNEEEELVFDDQDRLIRLSNNGNRNVSFSKTYSDSLITVEYFNGSKVFIYYNNNLPQKIKKVEGVKYISEIIFIFKYEFYD
jgi:hypothetical protein